MAEDAAEPPLMDADDTLSPVDLLGAPDGSALPWTSVTVATAALLLLLANAETLDGWARELPPSAYAERATALTGRWTAFTGQFGLGTPHAMLHAQWKRAEAARFK